MLASTTDADLPPIKIGLTGTFSGPQQKEGDLEIAAVNAYLMQHGDSIAGRKVIIVRRDEEGPSPDISRRIAQDLVVQDHVDFLVGGYYTPNALAIGEVSTEAKVPYVIVASGTSGITRKMPYSVRVGYTGPQEAAPIADWALKHGIKTVYALTVDNTTGIDTASQFEKTFTAGGGKIVGEIRVPLTALDFTAYVQRLKDAQPQAVFASFLSTTGAGNAFLHTLRTSGVQRAGIKVLSTMDLVSETELPSAGDDALGIVSAGIYSSWHPGRENAQFLAAVRAQHPKTDPDFLAAVAYDAIGAIFQAVAAQNGNIDLQRTIDFLKTMKLDGPRGAVMIDPTTRDVIQTMYIRQSEMRNGAIGNSEIAAYPHINASALGNAP